jgi:feruloyl-CoA synthase
VPGLELKVVPVDGLLEARLRGPNITPGYWRDAELTRAAFDAEGFYRMGDALLPVDPDDLTRGFLFHTRLNEDFKLSTGTWVRVGTVRTRLLGSLGDVAQDVVIAGHGRDGVSALIFPNALTCRALAGAGASDPFSQVLAHQSVRRAFRDRLAAYNGQNIGSSTGIQHALVLETPPSLEAMEITDKGSVNQRAVLSTRASLVEMLYAADGHDVLL